MYILQFFLGGGHGTGVEREGGPSHAANVPGDIMARHYQGTKGFPRSSS